MKSLYNSDYRYIPDASQLDSEATKMLVPLFEKYHAMGYSPREIGSILMHVVHMLEMEAVLEHGEQEG